MSDAGTFCIIGGGGFLGTALRRRLHESGNRVLVIGRRPIELLLPSERYVPSSAFADFARDCRGERFAAVVDLAHATVPSASVLDPIADITDNLRFVQAHVEAAQALGAERYVFVSSGGTIYGDSGQGVLTEDAPHRPISPYGIGKLACEHFILLNHRRNRLPALIVRPSNVFGPGQQPFRGQGLIATALAAALSASPLTIYGDGSQVRDFLYIDDLNEGLLAAITNGRPGESYNLGSGRGIRVDDVLERVSRIVAEDGLRLITNRQPGRLFDVHSNVLDLAKLRKVSGWQPKVSFDEGLRRAWHWIKRQS